MGCGIAASTFGLLAKTKKRGVIASALFRSNINLLLYAADAGSFSICQYLLGLDANVNHQDEFGNSALINAACNNHHKVCRLLIRHNADRNAQDINGRTAMENAIRYENFDTCKVLRNRLFTPSIRDRHWQHSTIFVGGYSHAIADSAEPESDTQTHLAQR